MSDFLIKILALWLGCFIYAAFSDMTIKETFGNIYWLTFGAGYIYITMIRGKSNEQ